MLFPHRPRTSIQRYHVTLWTTRQEWYELGAHVRGPMSNERDEKRYQSNQESYRWPQSPAIYTPDGISFNGLSQKDQMYTTSIVF